MNKIESFKVNHDFLQPGVYISRIDGNITTYDMRFIKPNTPPFLPNPVMHTIEHLFATYSRNSQFADSIVYFGPMGCRTGFYFLVKDLSSEDALALIKETISKCINHQGDIPGNSKQECGNYLEHDTKGANEALVKYFSVIKNKEISDLQYDLC